MRLDKRKALLLIFIIFLFFLFYKGFLEFRKNAISEKNQSIRSDLTIPVKSVFLHRQHLIDDMHNYLSNKQSIQTIALLGVVGMGGVGKTTLARYYGKSQKDCPVIWEINAETKQSLLNSFENLAYAIVKTKDQCDKLHSIQHAAYPEEKEKRLLEFIRECLKNCSSWILIYDNVENFDEIKNYFPHEAEMWGSGKAIVTTRDGNIRQNKEYFNQENIIEVGELDKQEALTIFCKILYNCAPNKITETQRNEALQFLENIPLFPLDVSTAAYYIKNENLTYKDYLQRINVASKDFEEYQQDLIKKATAYTQTRYGIISLAFEKIIAANPEFKDLLLAICLLDSQKIPCVFLEKYTNQILLDQFIVAIKEQGFITQESREKEERLFSLHRSTQNLGFLYLTSEKQKVSPQRIQKIISTFNDYIDEIIEREDIHNINYLVNHIEAFLSHKNIANIIKFGKIKDKLGYINYHYFRNYDRSREILETQLEEAKSLNDQDRLPLIKVSLGSVYFKLGNIKEVHSIFQNLDFYDKSYSQRYPLLTARLLSHLGYVYSYIGKNIESRKLLEQSLDIYKRSSSEHIGKARTLAYLGNTYRKLGFYKEALESLNESQIIYKRLLDDEHTELPWVSLYLGIAHKEQGDLEQAIKFLKESVKLFQKSLSEIHQDKALPLLIIGEVYTERKDYEQAKVALEKALLMYRYGWYTKDKKYTDINLASVNSHLGNLYRLMKKYDMAQKTLEESKRVYIENFGKDSPRIWKILYHLGCLYVDQNRFEDAESALNESLTISKKGKIPLSYKCLEGLGDLYVAKARDAIQKQKPDQAVMDKAKAKQYFELALKEFAQFDSIKNRNYAKEISFKLSSLTTE